MRRSIDSSISRIIGPLAAYFGEYLVGRKLHVSISEAQGGEVQAVREHLDNSGSVLMIWGPHTSMADPTSLTQYLINGELGLSDAALFAWLFSAKFTGQFPSLGGMGIFSAAWTTYARRHGFSAFPVAQKRYFGLLTPEEKDLAEIMNSEALAKSMDILKQPRSIVAVALEGGRFQNGAMQRADAGVSAFAIGLRDNPRVRILPVVLRGAHAVQPADARGFAKVNLAAPIEMVVGPMRTPREILDIARSHRWVEGMWTDRKDQRFTPADAMALELVGLGLEPYRDGINPAGVYVPENIVTVS